MLDLDLAVVDGELGFFNETAQLLGADELIRQLQGMVDEQGEKAQDEVHALRRQLEATQADLAGAREQAQADLAGAREAHLGDLRGALLALLVARDLGDSQRARILSCAEPAQLSRWLMRAVSQPSLSAAAVLAEGDAGQS